MLPKPKTPIKVHFLVRKKNIIINFYFFPRGSCLYICPNLDFKGVISIFALKKRGYIGTSILPPKPKKKTSKKEILNKTKTSHQRLLESSESDVFRFLDCWLLKGVFGFGGSWFIFNIKNMNPYKFSVFFVLKKQSQIMEKKIYICLKKYDKFHSNFFTWHWLWRCVRHICIQSQTVSYTRFKGVAPRGAYIFYIIISSYIHIGSISICCCPGSTNCIWYG